MINNVTKIINRFNEAIEDLACAEIALHNPDKKNNHLKHLRDAGEAISQTTEWALTHHLKLNTTIAQDKPNIYHLANYYINNPALKSKVLTALPKKDVNFNFFIENKAALTNLAKHAGKTPDFKIQKQYIEETRKFILMYIDPEASLRTVEEIMEVNASSWATFYAACDKFKEEGRNLILVVDDSIQNISDDYLKYLSLPRWNLIIDYDYNSESQGFFKKVYSTSPIVPHKIKAADKILKENLSQYSRSHYHFFANNFQGSGLGLEPDFAKWDKQYGKNVELFLKSYAEIFSNQKNIVVILMDSRREVNSLCERINRNFDGFNQFIIANDHQNKLKNIIEDFNALSFDISVTDILEGLRTHSSNFESDKVYTDKYFIPFMEKSDIQTSGELTADEYSKYNEYFEILHTGLPNENEDQQLREDFLRGKEKISWMGLKLHYDVEQNDFNKKYIRPIERAFANGRGKLILLHEPGYGGSTIARRIAWNFHNEYPTLILKQYKEDKIRELIISIHEKTRKTVFVIMEVPQSITLDDANTLYRSIQNARPVVFLIVKRGDHPQKGEMCVGDWGDEVSVLIKPYIQCLKEKYREGSVLYNNKLKELGGLADSKDADQKTPFYVGLVTFEKDFLGIKSYIATFVKYIRKNEIWKSVILYLSICDKYLGMGLPVNIFRPILKVSSGEVIDLEKYFGQESFIIGNLLYSAPGNEKNKIWKIRHNFFSRELLIQLLSGESSDPNEWKYSLSQCCLNFIDETTTDNIASEYLQDIFQKLFIGNKTDRLGEDFTPLINDISTPEGKEDIFIKLTEIYSDNPHYFSHLARLYAYDNKLRNNEKAIRFAEMAINISEGEGKRDHLLYHIKGMCIRSGIYEMIDTQIKHYYRAGEVDREAYDEIIYKLVDRAGDQFTISRNIAKDQNKSDEYGYIAHIQLFVRAIDFGRIVSGKSRSEFISNNKSPFAEWIDMAESLLEDVKRINDTDESGKIGECTNSILEFYEQYGQIIQNLNNNLLKSHNPNSIRRQIVRANYRKNPNYFDNPRTLRNIMEMMEKNIESEPNNDRNYYLWFQSARHSRMSVNEVITKMSQWKSNSNSIDVGYYFYILKIFRALEGYSDAVYDAKQLIRETKRMGKSNINIYDWYGKGSGIDRLVSSKDVDVFNRDSKLELVEGVITNYEHSGSATITIADGIEVFFNPTQAQLGSDHVNNRVLFHLGFSYDGPRADSSSIRLKK